MAQRYGGGMAAAVCRRAYDVEEDGHSVDTTTMSPLRAAAAARRRDFVAMKSSLCRREKQSQQAALLSTQALPLHWQFSQFGASVDPSTTVLFVKNIIQRPCF